MTCQRSFGYLQHLPELHHQHPRFHSWVGRLFRRCFLYLRGLRVASSLREKAGEQQLFGFRVSVPWRAGSAKASADGCLASQAQPT